MLPPSLSRDASHLIKQSQAGRDHILMATVACGALASYIGYVSSHGLGVVSATVAVGTSLGVGYSAVKLYQHLRQLDKKIDHLAQGLGQEPLPRSLLGVAPIKQIQACVEKSDIIQPDLVKAVANRRIRRWEATIDQALRPAQNRPTS